MVAITASNIQSAFETLLSQLSDKESYVITHRIGLYGHKETLQEIGDNYGITRERVRQIEDKGVKSIGSMIKSTPLADIQWMAAHILHEHSGIMSRDALVSVLIKELGMAGTINKGMMEVILQADFDMQKSKPRLNTVTYFHEPQITRKSIEAVHSEAVKILKKRRDVIEQDGLYEKILETHKSQFSFLTLGLIDAIMDVFLDVVKGEKIMIGLASWHILNPKTLKDKAIYIFKKTNKPLHFLELANSISGHFSTKVKVNTVHNELIRNNEFVLIGRGIYALKAWGYTSGTVQDVILEIFNQIKKPMSSDDITAEVLKTRIVKSNTIYMNLQNKKIFERVGRNLYQPKGMKK
jgi:hypothetical protein